MENLTLTLTLPQKGLNILENESIPLTVWVVGIHFVFLVYFQGGQIYP